MTKTLMNRVKMFPIAFGVAVIGFPIAGAVHGRARSLGIGSSPSRRARASGAAIALMGSRGGAGPRSLRGAGVPPTALRDGLPSRFPLPEAIARLRRLRALVCLDE